MGAELANLALPVCVAAREGAVLLLLLPLVSERIDGTLGDGRMEGVVFNGLRDAPEVELMPVEL